VRADSEGVEDGDEGYQGWMRASTNGCKTSALSSYQRDRLSIEQKYVQYKHKNLRPEQYKTFFIINKGKNRIKINFCSKIQALTTLQRRPNVPHSLLLHAIGNEIKRAASYKNGRRAFLYAH
jgi:hypothetical protein